jgi:purine-binding chemotaxis protein CheW
MPRVAVARAGDEYFGIDIDRIVEIVKAQRIYLLPQLPSFLAGVVNIRGEVIPLLDLRKRFGINSSSEKERIVVVRWGREKVGLLVDGVKEIVNLQPDEIIEPPSMFRGLKTEYLTGIGRRGEHIVIMLNVDTLLSSEEKIQMQAIPKEADTRNG